MDTTMLAKKILQITRHGYYEEQVKKIAQLLDSITSASNDGKPLVSGSKVIDKSRIDDFIKHWERIIYPYNEENDQHRAIKTVLVELENVCQAYCR